MLQKKKWIQLFHSADMRNEFKFIQYAHGKLAQLKDAFQSSIQC